MKNISTTLVNFLQTTDAFNRFDLVRIDLINGQHVFAVTGQETISFQGNMYSPTKYGTWERGKVTSEVTYAPKAHSMDLEFAAPSTVSLPEGSPEWDLVNTVFVNSFNVVGVQSTPPFTNPLTPGSVIIVLCSCRDGHTITSVTDTAGTTYVDSGAGLKRPAPGTGGNIDIQVFVGANPSNTTPANVITAHYSDNSQFFANVQAMEFTGAAASGVINQFSGVEQQVVSSNPVGAYDILLGTASTSVDGCLIVAVLGTQSGDDLTFINTGQGWNLATAPEGYAGIMAEYKVQPKAGSITPTFFHTNAEAYAGIWVAIKPGVVTGGSSPAATPPPLTEQILSGLFDGATVTVYTLYGHIGGDLVRESDGSPSFLITFKGKIANYSPAGRSKIKFVCVDMLYLLNHDTPPNVIQSGCRFQLFDQGCTLLQSNFEMPNSVASGSNGLFINLASNVNTAAFWNASMTFTQGTILFTSGLNQGLRYSIKTESASGGTAPAPAPGASCTQIQLANSLIFPALTGDTFVMYPGCAKTINACTFQFNNLIHIGAMPFVPNPEQAV